MSIHTLSPKQRKIYDFILSPDYALIADGAVRSGKTTHMAAAFLIWAMEHFDGAAFAVCGKTVQAAERNILRPLTAMDFLPYTLHYAVTSRCLTVTCGDRHNDFYFFGGKDESSYMLIQGATFSGVFFDEVALMPESFVAQALARCIACDKAKFWFNCNPEGPDHWFYRRWLSHGAGSMDKTGITHLHFSLEDNPILTRRMIEKTKALYSGVFYDRYILGKWVKAQGLIYPGFGQDHLAPAPDSCSKFVISMDYGIQNPTAMLLWGYREGVWYLLKEFYHAGRDTGVQMTDGEYYEALCRLAGDKKIDSLIIDPSASSFIALVRAGKRFKVRKAKNDVLPGIQRVAAALSAGKLKFDPRCQNTLREFGLYVWAEGEDKPKKENDHAMDAVRYFVSTAGVMKQRGYRPLWN